MFFIKWCCQSCIHHHHRSMVSKHHLKDHSRLILIGKYLFRFFEVIQNNFGFRYKLYIKWRDDSYRGIAQYRWFVTWTLPRVKCSLKETNRLFIAYLYIFIDYLLPSLFPLVYRNLPQSHHQNVPFASSHLCSCCCCRCGCSVLSVVL